MTLDDDATVQLAGSILRPLREYRESSRAEHARAPHLREHSTAILDAALGFRLAVQVSDEAAAVDHFAQLRRLVD